MQTSFRERFLSHFVVAGMTLLLCASSAAAATEYFVSLDGCDQTQDGRSRETAFATIQKGVDALAPGDTLTILPGEYRESVEREGLGSDDTTTTIRADIPGTVVLRGDIPAPPLSAVERNGGITIYAADLDPSWTVRAVNELDTLLVLHGVSSQTDLSFMPGFFYHDREASRLYLTTSDGLPPEKHRYSLSITPGDGLRLSGARDEIGPRRVVVEGLSATGFHAAHYGDAGTGVNLTHARDCVIRDCHAWMNGWGISVNSSPDGAGGNVIERCVAWANDSPFANSRIGGLFALWHRGDVIRDSTAFLNAFCGIYLRSDADAERGSRLTRNLSWGNGWDFLIKGNPGNHTVNVTEASVGPMIETRANPKNSLMFSHADSAFDPSRRPDTIVLGQEENIDPDAEFADPGNHDYRLQATSRFRGAGPDETDRGPFPYQPNIFYLSPDGDNSSDGLSMKNAWRSFARAVAALGPGDTLYLAPGVYDANVTASLQGDALRPIVIRGRGLEPVTLTGAARLDDSRHVHFERLQFDGPVRIEGGEQIVFRQSRFSGTDQPLRVTGSDQLNVTHCLFENAALAAITLERVADAHVSGNWFENLSAPAIDADRIEALRYVDYNAYRQSARAWRLDKAELDLKSIPGSHERYALELPASATPPPRPTVLHRQRAEVLGGPLGRPFGPYQTKPRRETLRLTTPPSPRSVRSTTATIEWALLLPARVEIAWGESPEKTRHDVIESDYFGSYSLTGLEPGKNYSFRIISIEPSDRPAGQHAILRARNMELSGGPVENGIISFSTPESDPEPGVYYVANDGDNANDGRSRASAWRTIQHAADQVGAGDTVMIAGGTYDEQVRVRASGAPEAPVTFRGVPGEKVVISADEREMDIAFSVQAKHHLRFDGLYLVGKGISLYKSTDIEISRMFAGRYSGGYAPALVNAKECNRVTLINSVSLSGKSGPSFTDCRDLRVAHCVFFRNMIVQLLVGSKHTESNTTIERNLFTDGLAKKFSAPMVQVGGRHTFSVIFRHNGFFPRRDWSRKHLVRQWTFDELDKHLGETDSLLVNPMFAGLTDVPEKTDDGRAIYPPDRMCGVGAIAMNNFFATHPDLIERGIGLQPEAFADFHFNLAEVRE